MRIEITTDIAACQHLRRLVFIEEQGVSVTDEVDGLDDSAIHLLALERDGPVGTARLLVTGDAAKIGRVCVLPSERGKGIGVALVLAALAELQSRPNIRTALLGSQSHVAGFYEKLGFVIEGKEFLDAGIPHRHMRRAI